MVSVASPYGSSVGIESLLGIKPADDPVADGDESRGRRSHIDNSLKVADCGEEESEVTMLQEEIEPFGSHIDEGQITYGKEQTQATRRLLQASMICAVFMVVEVVAGLAANSLALLTDAAHLLSDLASFLIALFAIHVSGKPGTLNLSFGYYRAEILGSLLSVALIWILTGGLFMQAVARFLHPVPIKGGIMLATAVFGTLANLVMTYILGVHSHGVGGVHAHSPNHHSEKSGGLGCRLKNSTTDKDQAPRTPGLTSEVESGAHYVTLESAEDPNRKDIERALLPPAASFEEGSCNSSNEQHQYENVNLKAAYLHALGDLIQNIGVMIAATGIWLRPKFAWMDPLCTLIFGVIVLLTTWTIIQDATGVLMEGVPKHTNPMEVLRDLQRVQYVEEVHDLHVWSISIGRPSMAVHLVTNRPDKARSVLRNATKIMQDKHRILHTTIQVDFSQDKAACGTDAHLRCH